MGIGLGLGGLFEANVRGEGLEGGRLPVHDSQIARVARDPASQNCVACESCSA